MRSRVRDNIAATTPLALHAVTEHMLTHELPAFAMLQPPKAHLDQTAVNVELYPETVTAWLDSVVVDEEHNLGVVNTRERVAYDVRFITTLGEVRVRLISFRQPVPLRVVGVPRPASPTADLLGALQRSVDTARAARRAEGGDAS